MKTSKMTGAALDWAVKQINIERDWYCSPDYAKNKRFTPSTDWAQGGPIIEREELSIRRRIRGGKWVAGVRMCTQSLQMGPTPLIAAMRCYVVSKLGEEVDIPKELT